MKRFFFYLGASLLLLPACNDESEVPAPNPRMEIDFPTMNMEQLNSNLLDFSINFFRQSASAQPTNLCVSPLSMGYCLGLALNGAEGDTEAEIRQVLGFGDASTADVNAYMKLMIETLPAMDNQTTFVAANSVWAKAALLPEYVETCSENYLAEIRPGVAFDSETVQQVNDWCDQKTNGLIPEFVRDFGGNTQILLLNALYFKSFWTEKFKEEDTDRGPFYLMDGQVQEVPIMYKSENIVAFEDNEEGIQLAKIPYGNGAFSMILVMPQEEQLPAFLAKLTPEMWDEWMDYQVKDNIEIYLPRFTMRYENENMEETLKAMGMEKSFLPEANFSKMSEMSLMLSKAMQKVYIEVDESGTEAAAVSGITGDFADFVPVESKILRFDHPFAFFITEESTGAMLFAGTVYRP